MYCNEIMNLEKPELNNHKFKRLVIIYHNELLQKIEDLNQEAYLFYIERKFESTIYNIVSELWNSDIWHRAKITHMELNYFINGALVCQFCKREIEDFRLRTFQLHHRNKKYDFRNVFSLNEVEIIHNNCHRKVHNKLNNHNRGNNK